MSNPIEELGDRATPVIDWCLDHWWYAFGLIGLLIAWYVLKLLHVLK